MTRRSYLLRPQITMVRVDVEKPYFESLKDSVYQLFCTEHAVNFWLDIFFLDGRIWVI